MALSAGTPVPQDLLSGMTVSDTITVVRLIGFLKVIPQSLTGQIDGVMVVDVGIGVSANEAFVAGVLPDPNIGSDVPSMGWLYRTSLVCVKVHSSGTDFEIADFGEVRFDTRAGRKVDRGRLYINMIAGVVQDTSFPVRVIGLIRALCLT